MSMCIWRAACGIISRQAVKFDLVPAMCRKGTGQQGFPAPRAWSRQGIHICAVVLRRYHDHVVAVVSRLVDGIKAKGSAAAIDVSDIAQRESFDVIGMVGPLRPSRHAELTSAIGAMDETYDMWSMRAPQFACMTALSVPDIACEGPLFP